MKVSFFFAIIFTMVFSSCDSTAQQQSDLSVDEFQKAITKPDVQVLDVRTMNEFQTGHLKNAMLADWNRKDEFKERVAALDKSKPVYTYCLSGGRSSAAAQYLRDNGFTTYNMSGGIAKWKQAGKPVDATTEVKQMSLKEYQSMIPLDKVVLVDVSAVWCPPCKKMNPVIDSLVQHAAKPFSLVKVDGGEQPKLIGELSVDAFPTFIIYKNGKEVWRKTGVVDAAEIVRQL